MRTLCSVVLAGCLVVLTGQNLVAQETPLTPLEQLGKALYFDHISTPINMACATCHAPEAGFTGPKSRVNAVTAVYPGAVVKRFGNRKPPSAAYAAFSPLFDYDPVDGLFFGGNFWDGRATGWNLGNPAADQALGPFLNPVEQNMPSREAVLEQVVLSLYTDLWEAVWGTPVDPTNPADYDRIGLAIAAFEMSAEVNPFSSKFDAYLAGDAALSPVEAEGLALFEGKAMCSACHVSEVGPNGEPPLFTDFTYDNLGTPRNPDNPFYRMDEVNLDDGSPINPDGAAWVDPGLAGFIAQLATSDAWRSLPYVTPTLSAMPSGDLSAMVGENLGKHKVPTLRNVDLRINQNFVKAYMHNGVFKTLRQVVHFYNTRDVGTWPPPEVADNVNVDELGNLALTDAEEIALVAFMKTLSDGYDPAMARMATAEPVLATTNAVAFNLAGPNPFNPATRLMISLPAAADLTVSVYAITGQWIGTLAQGWHEAGTHRIEFNGASLASGIYLVRLETVASVKTLKLTLLR